MLKLLKIRVKHWFASGVAVALVLSLMPSMALRALSDTMNDPSVPDALRRTSIQEFLQRTELKGVPEGDQPVPVLVQLAEQPAVLQFSSEEQVKNSQSSIVREVEKLVGHSVQRQFGYLLNGFAIEARPSDWPKIRAISGVESVRRIPIFYPSMQSAVDLTEVTQVWKQQHLQGEGMVVSIIDTGVDYEHEALHPLTDPSKARLTQEKVTELISSKSLRGKYYTTKVPYGYNYADLSDQVIPKGSQHGVHVAGIVGANGDSEQGRSIRGVAPEAQLLAMKVFSDSQSGASGLDIIAALEDSVKLGADVINMSLGSMGGFADEEDAYVRAVRNAVQAGCVVVVAAGNEGIAYDSQGTRNRELDLLDLATVGSPSTVPGAFSIASTENGMVRSYLMNYTMATGGIQSASYNLQAESKPADGKPHTVRAAGLGRPEDFKGDFKGKYALIRRGEIAFSEKLKAALMHHAEGVIMCNNAPGRFGMAGVESYQNLLFLGLLQQEDGENLFQAVQASPDQELEVVFGDQLQPQDNAEANRMSSFTSWGPTSELFFKPELAAPGGNIYSTISGNQYEVMSGTSMAAPHVAGATALLLQQVKTHPEQYAALDRSGVGATAFVKTVLENTAVPRIDPNTNLPYSPRVQGAGELQLEKALQSRVLATWIQHGVDPLDRSYGDISLGEGTGARTFVVAVQNFSSDPVVFRIQPGQILTEKPFQEGTEAGESLAQGASLTVEVEKLTLQPGETVKILCTLNPGTVQNNWIEGWLELHSETEGQPDLRLPYVGFQGDWNAQRIIDEPYGDAKQSERVTLLQKKFKGREMLPVITHSTMLVTPVFAGAQVIEMPAGDIQDLENYPLQYVGLSPNGDKISDEIFPHIGLLRGAHELQAQILDQDKNVLRTLYTENHLRKDSLPDLALGHPLSDFSHMKWDGKIPENPSDQDFKKTAEEGQYYYRLIATLREGDEPQIVDLPIRVDVTPPVLELADPDRPAKKNADGSYTVRVKYTETEEGKDGVGVNPHSIGFYSVDEALMDKVTVVVTPVDQEKGIYDVTLNGLPESFPAEASLGGEDRAHNPTEFLNLGVLGNESQPVLLTPDGEKVIEGDVYIHSYQGTEEGTAQESFLSTSEWEEFADVLEEQDGKEPFGMQYEFPEDLSRVDLNGKQFWFESDKPDQKIFDEELIPVALKPNQPTDLNITTYDANGGVEYQGKLARLILDPEQPDWEFHFESGVEAATMDLGDGNESDEPNVLFLPDDHKWLKLNLKLADNSWDYSLDSATLDFAIQSYERGNPVPNESLKMQDLKPDQAEQEHTLILKPEYAGKRITLLVQDRAGNFRLRTMRLFPQSMKDDPEAMQAAIENQESDSDSEEPVLQVENLRPLTTIGRKLPNDQYEVRGKYQNLDVVLVDGKPAILDPKAQTFKVQISLKNGINPVSVQGKRKNGDQEERLVAQKYVVYYDTLNPTVTLSSETQFHISGEYFFVNSDRARVKGIAEDDTLGFQVYLNGDVVASIVDINEAGQKKKFDGTTHVEDHGTLTLAVRDLFFLKPGEEPEETDTNESDPIEHFCEIVFTVIMDKEAPKVSWQEGVPAEGAVIAPQDEPWLKLSAKAEDLPIPQLPKDALVPVPRVSYRLNGEVFDKLPTWLPEGKYTIDAIATDAAGNETKITRTFTIGTGSESDGSGASPELVVQPSIDSVATLLYYKGTIQNAAGETVDPKQWEFHADRLSPDQAAAVQTEAKLTGRVLWDLYFVDPVRDERVPVESVKGMWLILPLDAPLQASGLLSYYVPETLVAEPIPNRVQADSVTLQVHHFSHYLLANVEKTNPQPTDSGSTGGKYFGPIVPSTDRPNSSDLNFGPKISKWKQQEKNQEEQKQQKQQKKPSGPLVPQTGETTAPLEAAGGVLALLLVAEIVILVWKRRKVLD